jgi:hypothetical protein
VIYFGDSDIPALMADFGQPVQIGEVTGVGIPDSEDEVFATSDLPGRGGVVISVSKITIQTSAFPDVAIDDPVIFDGQTYSVRECLRKGDGALTVILLGTAGPGE